MLSRFSQFFDRTPLRYVLLGLAAFAVCARSLAASFVSWDDGLLTDKLAVHGLSLSHLKAILVPAGMAWQPVRDLAFALTYAFSGRSPWGYHLVNTILYVAVCLLALRVLEAILARSGLSSRSGNLAAWLGALIFCLHPLHVEAFAWVQGNKDLLAGAFFLAAFLAHDRAGRAEGAQSRRHYLTGYALFLLALGSKPSAAAFPLVVLAYDLLLPPKVNKRSVRGLLALHLPYWLPAAALSVYFIFFTGAVQRTGLSLEGLLVLPQILAACYRLTLLPLGLLHRYPDPVFNGLASPAFWAGLITTVPALAFVLLGRRRHPAEAFGVLWFFLCWLPQSNLVPIAIRVADRYLFLSLLGPALAVSAAAVRLAERLRPAGQRLLWAAWVTLLVTYALLSVQRVGAWQDGPSLWGQAAESRPRDAFFQLGLAEVLIKEGDLERAAGAYERVLELQPGNVKALVNLGYTRKAQGRLEEALGLYQRALRIDSNNFNALNTVGNLLATQGQDSLAAEYYWRALRAEPDNYMARVNLAALWRRTGHEQAADSLMGEMEQVSLPQPVVLLQRGRQFILDGRLDSARARFERALDLDRELTPALAGLGEVLMRQDSTARALEMFRAAQAGGLSDWALLYDLGLAWSRLGQPDSALAYYRSAWHAQPDSSASALDYAVALARSDSLARAVEVGRALALSHPSEAIVHYNLGNWLLRLERYEDAAACYRDALAANPQDEKSHLNLGLLYVRWLNNPDSARLHLEASLTAAPNQPQAQSIRNTIEQLRQATGRSQSR